jgi:hypothetical protein
LLNSICRFNKGAGGDEQQVLLPDGMQSRGLFQEGPVMGV